MDEPTIQRGSSANDVVFLTHTSTSAGTPIVSSTGTVAPFMNHFDFWAARVELGRLAALQPRLALPAWMHEVYRLVASQRPDEAIDVLFRNVDELLSADRLTECEQLLAAFDVQRLDTNLLVGLLTATRPAKDVMTSRAQLVTRVERQLKQLAPERAERMLAGLR